jgi:hypothetical protein
MVSVYLIRRAGETGGDGERGAGPVDFLTSGALAGGVGVRVGALVGEFVTAGAGADGVVPADRVWGI